MRWNFRSCAYACCILYALLFGVILAYSSWVPVTESSSIWVDGFDMTSALEYIYHHFSRDYEVYHTIPKALFYY